MRSPSVYVISGCIAVTIPEETLVKRLVRRLHGDDPRQRFTALVRPHLDILYRMAWRWTGHAQDAEDLVQDLLVKLVDRLDEMERIEKLRPWLLRILYRRFVDQFRRRQRSPVDFADPQDIEDLAPEVMATDLENHDRVARALASLDVEQRDTILLHDVEGYTADEVADILDIRPGTVKSRVHRARNRMKELLGMEPFDTAPRVSSQEDDEHEL